MQKKRKTRWMIVCLAAGLLLSAEAVKFYMQSESVTAVIYAVLAVVFFLLALAYAKGKLK